jgi:hypothetical protein
MKSSNDVVIFKYEIILDLMLLERDHYSKEWQIIEKNVIKNNKIDAINDFNTPIDELKTKLKEKFTNELLNSFRDYYEFPVEEIRFKFKNEENLDFILFFHINVDGIIDQYLDFNHIASLFKIATQRVFDEWKLPKDTDNDISG